MLITTFMKDWKIAYKKTVHNIIFAKAGVSCFYESFVQGSCSVFQINICAKNPRLRKYEKRY